MRIAVNCRSIMSARRTGIGRYTYHLLNQLGQLRSGDTFTLYGPKRLFDFKRQLPRFPYPNFNPRLDYFGQGPKGVDVYHVPCPDRISTHAGKVVVTVHDLIYKTYPQAHTPQTIELTQGHMQEISRLADRIICISESTRRDLHRFFDLPQEKTCTVLNGVDHSVFCRISDLSPAQAFLKKLEVSAGFILFVGTIEPRKNLPGLLQAMAQLKWKLKPLPQLVVVGMNGWMTEQIADSVKQLGLGEDVVFTGFISDEQLNWLYNTCGVFVFPSFYEGFGFPVLEALCAGAAVVASSTSSCPEITADAAMLIDPNEAGQIAHSIEKLMNDTVFAEELKRKALKRAREFSFEKTARQTLEVYHGL